MAENKNITYLNKDFSKLKDDLINYSKNYFPDTYNDFSPASTGMLFIEMASYVGDVLSFYLDNQIQETFIQYARQKENLYNLSYMLGYKPKVSNAASTDIDFYQKIPAIQEFSEYVPDFNYALKIDSNASIGCNLNNSVSFIIEDSVDFSFSSSFDPTEISVYEIIGNVPTYFLLKKTRSALSANISSANFSFTSPKRFNTIEINDSNILGILDVKDSEGKEWFEVDSLAQDLIYDTVSNTSEENNNFYPDSGNTPNLLKTRQVSNRFVTRFVNESKLSIQFGAGAVSDLDEEIIPNPNNVGIGLPFGISKLGVAYSPLNFMFTDSYGASPSNTTLTFRYLTGGGIESNVPQNTLTKVNNSSVHFINYSIPNDTLAQNIFDSVACTNPKAATGGKDGDNIEEIRSNALGSFQGQLRTVTDRDYVIRALSMPSSLGSVAKVYPRARPINENYPNEIAPIDLYILSYDNNKKLITPSVSLKQNLSNYLKQYVMINDLVNIKDAFVVNIGINFDIVVLPNFNSNEVILRCINAITDYFYIDKRKINQPIMIRDLYILMDKIKGVQTVSDVSIVNKVGTLQGYSTFSYDIPAATINHVVYPSLDPMIFEIKNPQTDIFGRSVNLF